MGYWLPFASLLQPNFWMINRLIGSCYHLLHLIAIGFIHYNSMDESLHYCILIPCILLTTCLLPFQHVLSFILFHVHFLLSWFAKIRSTVELRSWFSPTKVPGDWWLLFLLGGQQVIWGYAIYVVLCSISNTVYYI